MKPVRLISARVKGHALFYALLAICLVAMLDVKGASQYLTRACAIAENLPQVVSGTSGAIHGGSSPLERTFCKAYSFEELAKNSGDPDRSSARGSSPHFAEFCPLFCSLFSRGKTLSSLSILAAVLVALLVAGRARGRAPPQRKSKRRGNKSRRFGSDESETKEISYKVGVRRILAVSKATVPRWVRREVVYRALGIGSRTLDDWIARHRMLYRKFPSDHPKNGIVLFPAPWLVGLTGPIEIEVISGEEDGEPLVLREILPEDYFKLREDICRLAGLEWPRNAGRKSFATFHYLHTKDEGLTRHIISHQGDNATFVNHYKAAHIMENGEERAIMPADIKAYWALPDFAKQDKPSVA